MLEGEIENARHVWDPAKSTEEFVRYLMRNGMDAETAGATAGTIRLGVRVPERLIPLSPGEIIEFADSESRIVHTPGHSDFHLVLHDEGGGSCSPGTTCCSILRRTSGYGPTRPRGPWS